MEPTTLRAMRDGAESAHARIETLTAQRDALRVGLRRCTEEENKVQFELREVTMQRDALREVLEEVSVFLKMPDKGNRPWINARMRVEGRVNDMLKMCEEG